MAQAIHCDVHGREHLADVLVSQIATGDTMAACFLGYVELARALVADADVRDAAEAAELAAIAADEAAQDRAEADATDADALARLAAIAAAGEPAQLGELAEALEPPMPEPSSTAEASGPGADAIRALGGIPHNLGPVGTAPAVVVKRGTSRSRKAHQQRQRARKAQVALRAALADNGAPGPPGEPQDDPGGGTAPA